MRHALPRRILGTAWMLLPLMLLACSTVTPGRVPDSQLSFDRTFDMAQAAMADQKLVFSVEDRRGGRIVGAVDGQTIVTTLQPLLDGTLRVNFTPQGDSPAAVALQQRVVASYNVRLANLSLLGGFKGSGSDRGPVPCPSGPAFCN